MAGTKTETVEFCGELKHPTPGAYLVSDGIHEEWLPRSQVISMRRIGIGDDFVFVIPYWLAKKKGII